MSYQTVDLSISEGLARLVLNQPEAGNPINAEFCAEWVDVANELSSRSDVRAILISARGKFFSVGGDISMFTRNLDGLPAKIREWTSDLHGGVARMARLDAPIVACVQGTCMGGACGLVAGCDVVYSAASARFGAAYPLIGYSVDAGSTTTFAQRMGVARARRFLLLAEVMDAKAALAAGLVDHVLDDAAVFAEAEQAAIKLSRGPTRAYGEIRRLLGRALTQPFDAQLEDEAQGLSRVAGTADAREGIMAFAEKRKPRFTGQ